MVESNGFFLCWWNLSRYAGDYKEQKAQVAVVERVILVCQEALMSSNERDLGSRHGGWLDI
jgi:hypothetical protein